MAQLVQKQYWDCGGESRSEVHQYGEAAEGASILCDVVVDLLLSFSWRRAQQLERCKAEQSRVHAELSELCASDTRSGVP